MEIKRRDGKEVYTDKAKIIKPISKATLLDSQFLFCL